jgi:ketosteroid isomerase-like protein
LPQRIIIHEERRITKEFPSVPVVAEVIPLNVGDAEGALAYWADDATVKLVGVPPDVQDSYRGREQVCGWFKDLIAQHFQIQVKVIKVQGNAVTTRTQTWDDTTRQLGIAPLVAIEVYVVNDEKIACLTSTISPKSRLRFQSALHVQV